MAAGIAAGQWVKAAHVQHVRATVRCARRVRAAVRGAETLSEKDTLMKIHIAYRALMLAVALAVIGLSGRHATLATVTRPAVAAECEGDACAVVAVTFDETKQQYRAQNNSPDRWVRVVAANVASASDLCVGPGKAGYLQLKSIVGPYRAGYAEPRCGAPE